MQINLNKVNFFKYLFSMKGRYISYESMPCLNSINIKHLLSFHQLFAYNNGATCFIKMFSGIELCQNEQRISNYFVFVV